jgi:hypothetical protein
MSHLTNTVQAPATNPYTTRNFDPNKYKKILPKILFPTHCHPLEQSNTEHQSRPFPTELQTLSTLLLQSQTVYLHTTIDNYDSKIRCTASYMHVKLHVICDMFVHNCLSTSRYPLIVNGSIGI